MSFILRGPHDSRLNKFIENFYFFDNEENIDPYVIYPCNSTVLSIHYKADVLVGENSLSISENPQKNIQSILVGPFDKNKVIRYTGKVNVFTIIFKNYGLHKFFDSDLYFLNNKIINNLWVDGKFHAHCELLMKLHNHEDKFLFIEEYLLEEMKDTCFSQLDYAIDTIQNDHTAKVEKIAKALSISKKTLIQKFNKYIGVSPSQFRNVDRFRKIYKSDQERLTELSYEFGFYDQAHMIKSFKKITNESPLKFFKKENISGTNEIMWIH